MNRIVTQAAEDLQLLRDKKPLIHHITNMVVMNQTANATLCIGALPVMSHSRDEVEEMATYAGALLLNIGTLTTELIDSMLLAGKRANELGIPVIFDPVGAGATALRTDASFKILRELDIAVIRGNSAEISLLSGNAAVIKGVESISAHENIEYITKEFARNNNTVVCVTGKTDVVTDGTKVARISNGHEMMSRITGTGCMSTTIVAAFAAVQTDYFAAASGGLIAFGLAGEMAAWASEERPGTFQVSLIDALYALEAEDIEKGARIEVLT